MVEYAPLAADADLAISRALSGAARGIAVATSGSTGEPREVLLSSDAIRASAAAAHAALGGPGCWLLALSTDRIAGAMVLARSRIADAPVTTMPGGSFTAEAFASASARLPGGLPRYVSLVPTQLYRLLDSAAGRDALAEYDAVLVGGAALHAPEVPANVVRTYGSTETSGGCVYNGEPIGDARIDVVEGLVRISGSTLAEGYADGDNSRFVTARGDRWFVTSDMGEVGDDGRLTVLGRADDVIVTGGVKVAPGTVEAALGALPWVAEAVVVPVADAEWGQAVVALATARPGQARPPDASVRSALAPALSRAHVPRTVHIVDVLPRLSSGKIDRAEAARIATQLMTEQGETWQG